ncbi:hypothetical protein ACGFJC_30420 [Nonomuraea fuscirosea]|jgi:hypothetical protein|uniref:Uncharacterized protein n=1 Tax=Nonomuraea fuscirosea TaxID=1291556 RepID=A0A2T0MNE4_9ACTN|nr:hypothetical protein [Nonomuraea fuscirosea]PRX59395.1 hypothetical protein B0I32_120166 [Nonomuraea fuscirosea]WSA49721.1 hypothetical protein OIE67_37455 [Nonomuraea fuscirosea]
MRRYTGNRVGLAVVGATLLGLGIYAWLRGEDRFLGLPPGARVLPAPAYRTLAEEPWPLWFLALGLMLLALVSLRWLLLCLGWGRRGTPNGTGTAMLFVGLKGVEGLGRAGVRVADDGLRIALTCPAAADVGAVVGKLDGDIVGRIRREVRDDETPAVVRLHVRRPVSTRSR